MDLFWYALTHDWAVLSPIVLCSVITLSVTIERWMFYLKNRRDVVKFIHILQRELDRGLEHARAASAREGGILGEVAEEGTRILAEQRDGFDRLFDITTSLATRKLEHNLSILGTIATISPYLGLFGTVIRILLTFGELHKSGGAGGAPEIMFGIGSALIATAFGLGVAIAAVAINNYFHTIVHRYDGDFQVLKLLFIGASETHPRWSQGSAHAKTSGMERVQI